MNGRRGWLVVRLSMRLGRRRWLLGFPPERPRWLIPVVVLLLLIGYVVGAIPTVMALEKSGLPPAYREPAISILYAPLIWLDSHVPWCHWFFEAEGDFLTWLFGL